MRLALLLILPNHHCPSFSVGHEQSVDELWIGLIVTLAPKAEPDYEEFPGLVVFPQEDAQIFARMRFGTHGQDAGIHRELPVKVEQIAKRVANAELSLSPPRRNF